MYRDQAQPAAVPKEATLNDRLNKVADSLQFQCDRIESVLARVQGTPPTPATGNSRGGDVSMIRPTHALVQIVEALEQTNQRLASLATGTESIA